MGIIVNSKGVHVVCMREMQYFSYIGTVHTTQKEGEM
jgi:hypothetical protein